ncbi:hypothetical protein OSTOST_01281 [Ostertagia ostertagi]
MGASLQNPTEAPFRWWVRCKLLVVDRLPITPSPGLPTADGRLESDVPVFHSAKCSARESQAEYHNPLRFHKTKSVRPGPAKQRTLPGEFHHSISENYYYNRQHDAVQVNKRQSLLGYPAPTPGFGFEWKRTRDEELQTEREDPELSRLVRFDRFAASK